MSDEGTYVRVVFKNQDPTKKICRCEERWLGPKNKHGEIYPCLGCDGYRREA